MVGEALPVPESAPALADPFEIRSIRPVTPPSGAAGALWCRYEIGQGANRIVGFRTGDLAAVTAAVESMVWRLNERRYQRRGRVDVVLGREPAARARP